jgi:acetyl esterase
LSPKPEPAYAGLVTELPPRLRASLAVQRAILPRLLSRPTVCTMLAGKRLETRDGRTLDRETAAVLALADLDPAADITQYAPAEARLRLAMQIALVDAPAPPGVAAEDHLATGPAAPVPVRLYTPPGAIAPAPAVVYFHGGGWVTGSVATHDALCRRIALGARCRVASVEYRLAPEHRFPAAVEDAIAAFRWIARNAADLGIDAARLAVMGDSAGGNLAAVVSRRTREDARRPALQVLVYPSVDGTRSLPSHVEMSDGYFLTEKLIQWFFQHYVGHADPAEPDLAPLFADVRGMPPALIYTAGFDPLRDEGLRFAERLRDERVEARYWEFPSLIHGFALTTGAVPAARRAVEEIIADVGRALAR